MVSIYTKNGDGGETSLRSGARFPKSDTVFEVLGTLDELNASLSLVPQTREQFLREILSNIQNQLFHIGSYVASSSENPDEEKEINAYTEEFEKHIDFLQSKVPELRNFILPGGSRASSGLHFSRAICRRLERVYDDSARNNPERSSAGLRRYFNRLSDLLFVLARYANYVEGLDDIIWKP